jgi:hypothetical protein
LIVDVQRIVEIASIKRDLDCLGSKWRGQCGREKQRTGEHTGAAGMQ